MMICVTVWQTLLQTQWPWSAISRVAFATKNNCNMKYFLYLGDGCSPVSPSWLVAHCEAAREESGSDWDLTVCWPCRSSQQCPTSSLSEGDNHDKYRYTWHGPGSYGHASYLFLSSNIESLGIIQSDKTHRPIPFHSQTLEDLFFILLIWKC